jgi:O-antigen ligase
MIRIGIHLIALYSILSLTSMAGMNIGFALILPVFLISLLQAKKTAPFSWMRGPDFKGYLMTGGALFVTCLISLVVAKIAPFSYAAHAPEVTVHGFLKIWYLLSPFILAVSFSSQIGDPRENIRFILRAWWAMVLFLGVVAIIQFNTGWPHRQPIPTNMEHFHATLFFHHHLSTASILIFPTFTAFAVTLGRIRRKEPVDIFVTSVSLVGIMILFLSYARTAWLALPIGIVVIGAKYLKPKTLLINIISLIAVLAAASQTSAMKERIMNSMGIVDRLRLWEANLDYFKHRPITGIGWLKTQEMSEFYFKAKDPTHYHDYFWGHAHNNFFEMLGGTGLLGTLAFLAWTFFTFRLAIRTRKLAESGSQEFLADVATGIFVALILLHFNGLTNVTFWEGKVMHQQMFGIGLLFMIQIVLRKTKKVS